ncbi:MAG TPA: redoxin domain-containing protein [Planctomycetota bacterium]|nr:redoxin domain-containing protein [Planctomycetota bacterium]
MSCADELRGLGEVRKALQSKGGDIIAISTEKPERLKQNRESNKNLPCVLASDPDGSAATTLQLLHEGMGKIGKKLFVPANILLDDRGVVVWTHYARTVMDRPDPAEVLNKVLAVGSNAALLKKR